VVRVVVVARKRAPKARHVRRRGPLAGNLLDARRAAARCAGHGGGL